MYIVYSLNIIIIGIVFDLFCRCGKQKAEAVSWGSPAISELSEEEKDGVTDDEVKDEEASKEQVDNNWILAMCSSPEPQGVT